MFEYVMKSDSHHLHVHILATKQNRNIKSCYETTPAPARLYAACICLHYEKLYLSCQESFIDRNILNEFAANTVEKKCQRK